MFVEGRLVDNNVAGDRFPVGMRVLAVDDDETCLKTLECLLRKCQYQVTTTTESIKALEILRNNRNMFDLVISDVNMPDMDGFKLLELVGHEMDLPVIRYSDKERVMRGVIHGACDYLMKPVRIEEIQNIWQHVVRRKIDCKDQNKSAKEEKPCNMDVEVSQGVGSEHNADQNRMLGQKRKAQIEEEEQDNRKHLQGNEELSNQKKPRLVWGAELHSKFVVAVNELGCDKAVPKKILDLMKVEGLTRENVASHLQKYRLSLRKPNQQASMVAVLRSSDPYAQMGLAGGYGDFGTLSGLGRISSSKLPPYSSGGMFCSLDSPFGLNMRGISYSSAVMQPFQSQKSMKRYGNIQLPMLCDANQSSSLPLPENSSSPMHNSGDFRNHSSLGVSPSLLNYNPKSWQSAAQLSNLPVNSSPPSEVLNNDQVLQNYLKPHCFTSHTGNSPVDSCSTSDINVQDGLLGNIILASGYTQPHKNWEADKEGHNKDMMKHTFNSMNSVVPPNGGTNCVDQNNTVCSKSNNDAFLVSQLNEVAPSTMHSSQVGTFYLNAGRNSHEASLLEQMKLIQSNYNKTLYEILGDRDGQNAVQYQNLN